METFNGGTLSGNAASNNGAGGGFEVYRFNGGTISGNTATGNTDDGFDVSYFKGGNTATFSLNEATDTTSKGYHIRGQSRAGAESGSGSHRNNG